MQINQARGSLTKSLAVVIAVIVIIAGGAGAVFFLHNPLSSVTNPSSVTIGSSHETTSGVSSTPNSTSTSNYSDKYLPYNNTTKTVAIQLVTEAGLSTLVNYNGTNKGAMIIYVPAGSNLNITLNNQETLPHNLVLVRNTTAYPNNANVGADGTVLFGVATSITDYRFTGNKTGIYSGTYDGIVAGTYWLACGINKHAGDGLWVDLFALASVTSPYVVITNPALQPAGFS